ncbi:MAG: hypothetical protein ACI4UT_01065 [Candidatus Enteromonas sp.]
MMKKYLVGLLISSVLCAIAVPVFVYLIVQTVSLAFFVDPRSTSFPWYGFLPAMISLVLIMIPVVLVVAFSASAIRKSRLTHSPVQNANKGIFWSSIALLITLLALYIFSAALHLSGSHVWFAVIGTDRGLLLLTLITVLLAVFPVWNCFAFHPFPVKKAECDPTI